jgi:inhibitor of cysteine peptidase
MDLRKHILLAVAIILIMVAIGGWILIYFSLKWEQNLLPDIPQVVEDVTEVIVGEGEVVKFNSSQEFKEYLAQVRSKYTDTYGSGGFSGSDGFRGEMEMIVDDVMAFDLGEVAGMGSVQTDRVSGTNVQVVGIDEPDVLKTDGQEIYYSQEDLYYYWRDYYGQETTTKLINALPVESIVVDGEIELNGDLLLVGNTLLIFEYEQIVAFDVSYPSEPAELWTIEYSDAQYQDARLYNGELYLLTYTWINDYTPCPFEPVSVDDLLVSVECGDIYHPVEPVPTDITYNLMKIDPISGDIQEQISLVSAYSDSVLYMSAENIYIATTHAESFVTLVIDFFDKEAYSLVSMEVLQKIRNLNSYEISDQAKMVEFQVLLDEHLTSMDEDERLEFETEFENKMDEYLEGRKRELTTTKITVIDFEDLEVKATGDVPGTPLNQWSLDEHDGYLRIATTVGGSGFWGWMFGSSTESANDLYVLNDNMNVVGEVLDLGLDERIYSARFIGDEGYMVTFRETDPFYVFDLSNPRDPEMVGELKIPGYSSYLHPLTEDLILGIGQDEDWMVKMSLFDVSDPTNPTEISKYSLDEYWSEALETHHAFLQDAKYGVFFMPGSKGGYIMSYAGGELTLQMAVANVEANRALYINDLLYIFSQNEVVVVDETTWERVGELEL